MKLKGKTAIITGAGSGQGEAASSLFAINGARVAAMDIDADRAQSTAVRIRSEGHPEVLALQGDVKNEAAVQNCVDRTIREFGGIDILVNCAGVRSPSGKETMAELSLEDWQRTIDVNLLGPWICIKSVIPIMRKQGFGSIINVSSTAAVRAIPGASPYCATKAALVMLTKTAALEFIGDGIRVNTVMPGHIDTPMMDSVIADMEKSGISDARNRVHTQSNPIGRLGTPLEIAEIILFLASDESSFITGTEIYGDGGLTAG